MFDSAAADFRALTAVLHEAIGLRWAILAVDDSLSGANAREWLVGRRPYLAEMKCADGQAMACACPDFTCQAPVVKASDLRVILERG